MSLQTHGYHILTASNGDEALRLFKDYPGKINLLLTDVVMPHMGGKELADKVAELQPDIKIIFTSGYTNDTISHYGVLAPGVTFYTKAVFPPKQPGGQSQRVVGHPLNATKNLARWRGFYH
jgi:CheY-like chemotaxis protein